MSRGRTRGETDSFFDAAMEIAMKASLAKAELPGKEAAPAVEQQAALPEPVAATPAAATEEETSSKEDKESTESDGAQGMAVENGSTQPAAPPEEAETAPAVEQQAALPEPVAATPAAATEEETPESKEDKESTESDGAQGTAVESGSTQPAAPPDEAETAPVVKKKLSAGPKPYKTHEEVDQAKPIDCNTGESVTDDQIDDALLKKPKVMARLAVTPASITFAFSKRVVQRAKHVVEKQKAEAVGGSEIAGPPEYVGRPKRAASKPLAAADKNMKVARVSSS